MRLGIIFSMLAALLLVPAAASAEQVELGPSLHPSGNDRTVEPGGSGTQGNAQADPDGMANWGVDQEGGDGGLYLGDQDGNNGCGNDHDFEDDNNGNCGPKVAEECPDGTTATYTSSLPEHSQGRSARHVEVTCEPECDPLDKWSYCDDESEGAAATRSILDLLAIF